LTKQALERKISLEHEYLQDKNRSQIINVAISYLLLIPKNMYHISNVI